MRNLITPGRLYAKLSREFRQVCCEKCVRCILPTPLPFHGGNGGPTWQLTALPDDCSECAGAIEEIVRRHQDEYDLMDPVSSFLDSRGTHLPDGRLSRH